MNKTLARITRANITLASSPPFALLSGILASLRHRVCEDGSVSTAATDGINVWWSEEFVETLDNKQLAFVVGHEAAHSFFMHNETLIRLKLAHRELADAAADFVVNAFLKECDPDELYTEMPQSGLYDSAFTGMDTYQVVRELLKDQEKKGGKGQNAKTLDVHMAGKLSEEDMQELAEAIEQGKRSAAGRGNLNRDYDETSSRQRDYTALLSQWLYSASGKGDVHVNWKSPNRRMLHKGIYLPSRKGKMLRTGVLAIDTSGSIGDADLGQAISIMKAIVSQVGGENLHILYWDDGVASHEHYRMATNSKISQTHPKGGGGTTFSPVLSYVQQHKINPDVMVIVTDGYVGDWGSKPKYPTLCLSTTPEKAPWGMTLRI